MKRTINMLKVGRLVVAILMIVNMITFKMIEGYYDLPDLELVITLWMSLFVMLLGFQYHLEKKMGFVALFLILFAIMMAMMTILGFFY